MSHNIILTPQEQYYTQVMTDLHKVRASVAKEAGLTSSLHPDQVEVLKSLYVDKKANIFCACARKYGKTQLASYVLWRQALLVPNSECFYVTPEAAHGRKIIWNNGRLQRYLEEDSDKYIKSIRDQEMIIRFHNGSFIQLVGSDNYMVANGLSPHIAVYDEFKGFNPRWHVEFAPNRTAHAAPFVFIGTKPRAGNKNLNQYNEILAYAKKNPDSWAYFEKTTWDNPINHLPAQKKAIEEEIAQLIARGEDDVVELEYYSREVRGGKRSVFPMLQKEVHVKDHRDIEDYVRKNQDKLDFYCIADPATGTTFGVIFAAINRFTNEIMLIDELYVKDRNSMSTSPMVMRIREKMRQIAPLVPEHDWYKAYDDAAAWFANEALSQHNLTFFPAQKWKGDKEEGLSLIKDCLLAKVIYMSERCENLFDEMIKYSTDENGVIPKRTGMADHLIDCLRYLLTVANYDFQRIFERDTSLPDYLEDRRDEILTEEDIARDWTLGIDFIN